MPTSIPINKKREQQIKLHIKSQERDAGGKDQMRSAKITIKGQTKLEPIYRFDIDDLAFNKNNGRIKAEILDREAELGRELDEFKSEDQKIIRDILLSIRIDENEKIKEDLIKNTQIIPGITTADGVVINGNRRKAIFHELYDTMHDDKYKYLDVHILPSDIKKKELWLIEAGIQLSAPQQLDYSPINNLLKLREGIDSGLSVEDMTSRIYGVSKEKIESDLERLELIDEYLEEFLNKEKRYFLIRGSNEHFIDLKNVLDWALKYHTGTKLDWSPNDSDINELKLVGFYYIRSKYPHLRIRDLKNIFSINKSWLHIRKSLEIESEISKEELVDQGYEVDKYEFSDIDLEDDADEFIKEDSKIHSKSEGLDLRDESIWRDINKNTLKGIYEDAKEQEKITQDSEKPLVLAKRALKNIEAIPEDKNKLSNEIDVVLSHIVKQINFLRKIIQRHE